MDLDTYEGWIAGLQLAALAMKGREYLKVHLGFRAVLLYIGLPDDEVLAINLSNFLMQTSILSRLRATCATVTGRSDGQAMLEQIESKLFLIRS
jgi:ATP/maltotriose-dependent transcriptional regulator MalT